MSVTDAKPRAQRRGTVLGFRAWEMRSSSNKPYDLTAPTTLMPLTCKYCWGGPMGGGSIAMAEPYVWKPTGVNEARCMRRPFSQHKISPTVTCMCGLHSCHSLQEAASAASLIAIGCVVWGAVLSWGVMDVHRDGVRAQYSKIAVLADMAHTAYGGAVREYAVSNGVPITPFEFLETVGREWGKTLPELWPDFYKEIIGLQS